MIKFPYFNGNITDSKVVGYVTMEQFIRAHRRPSAPALTLLDRISKSEKKERLLLKRNLHYFTPSVNIKIGERRLYDNILSFTGIMVLDFDDEPRAKDLKAYLWGNYPQLYCAYISPSRKGVKCLMKIPIVKSIKEYKEYFIGVENEFHNLGIDTLDHCNYTVTQPLYLSYDTELLYRNNPTEWTTKISEKTHEELENYVCKAPLNTIIGGEDVYKSIAYYRKISIDIFVKKIRNIVGTPGHTVVRDASIVLGSRCGAGYLTTSDAIEIAKHEIYNNKYLQKNLKGYEKTGISRIILGSHSPRFYN